MKQRLEKANMLKRKIDSLEKRDGVEATGNLGYWFLEAFNVNYNVVLYTVVNPTKLFSS